VEGGISGSCTHIVKHRTRERRMWMTIYLSYSSLVLSLLTVSLGAPRSPPLQLVL